MHRHRYLLIQALAFLRVLFKSHCCVPIGSVDEDQRTTYEHDECIDLVCLLDVRLTFLKHAMYAIENSDDVLDRCIMFS